MLWVKGVILAVFQNYMCEGQSVNVDYRNVMSQKSITEIQTKMIATLN